MGKYTTFLMFENPRRGRQARNFTENDPKILDLKSSSEQIIFRKLSLGAPDILLGYAPKMASACWLLIIGVFTVKLSNNK